MMLNVEKTIENFVVNHLDIRRGLLVALSGGCDSLALLIGLSKIPGLTLAVAHVDHGWRESSHVEAAYLEELSKSLGYPFHLKVLDPNNFSGNLENYCRESRYAFFSDLIKKYDYQGVALGHHADDQVETVLKRVLEGCHLTKLSGIEPIKHLGGTKLFRPLLTISKKSLVDYVKSFSYEPVVDSTNEDLKFLRARMRSKILPMLQQDFGKNIQSSLIGISQEARELTHYLDERIHKYISGIVAGPMGIYLDLSCEKPSHSFEMKYLIKKVAETIYLSLPKKMIENLCNLIYSGIANKKVSFEGVEICIDRGFLFFFNKTRVELPKSQSLILGLQEYGPWKILVEEVDEHTFIESKVGWKNIWKGELSVCVPKDKYFFSTYISNYRYRDKGTLSKWLGDNKVPMCLRSFFPVLVQDDLVMFEFLTEKEYLDHSKKISIKLYS